MSLKTDEVFMRRCLQLARNGSQNSQPNPMVGAVIVHEGRIIGEGYHVRCGEGHAEVNAFASVKPSDEPLLSESTIYVSLEPCSHYGKTPPCADLIVRKGVKRCVVGCIDPFSKVKGKGIEILKSAGIEVTVGVLEKECREINKRFMTFHQFHRPFITLKWAQTKDGFIAYKNQQPGKGLHISNAFTQTICHKRRAEHQAILVGRTTVGCDNPSLTVRLWKGMNPLRCVLGDEQKLKEMKMPDGSDFDVLSDSSDTLIAASIDELLKKLYDRGVQSLLVEGGRKVLQSFIDRGLWDETYVETGSDSIREGIPAPILK